MARIPNSCLVCAFPIRSGLGRSARNLFELGFFEQLVFLKFHRNDPEAGYPLVVRSRWDVLGGAGALASQYLPSSWKDSLRSFDVVHFQSPHFFHLAPVVRHATGTVHDVLFFDPTQRHGYPVGARLYFQAEFRHAARLQGIATDSAETDRAVRDAAPNARTTVIHLWTDSTFRVRDRASARTELGLPADPVILLSVGTDAPRKNLEILPKIMNELGEGYFLVRIGRCDRILPQFRYSNVRVFESVPDDRYPGFFNASDMLLQPSREEGFGYPVVEAINSGIPVIASNIPVFEELLGRDYPFRLDPDASADWVAAVRTIAAQSRTSGATTELYRDIGSKYREERAVRDFEVFFRGAGIL